jgi:hypothetical protein
LVRMALGGRKGKRIQSLRVSGRGDALAEFAGGESGVCAWVPEMNMWVRV